MKNWTFLLIFGLFNINTFAQTQTISNQHVYGTSNVEGYPGSIICQDGGILLFCTTDMSINGTKTSPCYGGSDIWLIKLDQNNNYLWDKSFGGSDDEQLGAVIELNNGELLIGGTTKSPISGNQTVGTKGLNDYWIIKLTSNGDEIWQKSFGGADHDLMADLIQISSDKYIVTGRSFSNISGDKTELCRGSVDTWSIIIDSSGVILYDKTFGGSLADTPVDLTYKHGEGAFYLLTFSNSNISGDKTENCYGWDDTWILAIDTNLNLINQKTIGGSADDNLTSIIVFEDSSILLCGSSSSGISGNKTSPISGSSDAWLVKLTSDFDILFDLSFGGDGSDGFSGMIRTINNNLFLYGGSSSSNSGIIEELNNGLTDNWILSLDENLLENFSELIGGDNAEGIVGFFEKSNNNFTVVSLTYSGISGDKIIPNFGDVDFWVFDLSTNLSVGEKTGNEQVRVFPNPNHGTFKLQGLESNTTVVVSDMSGKVISEQRVQTPNEEIKLNNLTTGMYLVHLKGSNNTRTLKFVIE